MATFGSKFSGGDSTAVAKELEADVVSIYPVEWGFMAIKTNGSAVLWSGVFSGALSGKLSLPCAVSQVYTTAFGFALLLVDGRIAFQTSLNLEVVSPHHRVLDVCTSETAFVALKSDGTVVTWGVAEPWSRVPDGLQDAVEIHSCVDSFAAVTRNGNVVAWGGETKRFLKLKLEGFVKEIYREGMAYAVVWNSGFVECGDCPSFICIDSACRGESFIVPDEINTLLQNAVDKF